MINLKDTKKMNDRAQKTAWNITIFVFGIAVGILLVAPRLLPRYEIRSQSVIVMRIDRWTGQTWLLSQGKWKAVEESD